MTLLSRVPHGSPFVIDQPVHRKICSIERYAHDNFNTLLLCLQFFFLFLAFKYLIFFGNKIDYACNFIKKESLAQVFSCEFCEISKKTFFTEHLWATASELCKCCDSMNLKGPPSNWQMSWEIKWIATKEWFHCCLPSEKWYKYKTSFLKVLEILSNV